MKCAFSPSLAVIEVHSVYREEKHRETIPVCCRLSENRCQLDIKNPLAQLSLPYRHPWAIKKTTLTSVPHHIELVRC